MSEVLVKFDHPAPKEFAYMAHCHLLEHEDTSQTLPIYDFPPPAAPPPSISCGRFCDLQCLHWGLSINLIWCANQLYISIIHYIDLICPNRFLHSMCDHNDRDAKLPVQMI